MGDLRGPAPLGERRQHFRSRSRPGRRIELQYRRTDQARDFVTAVTANIGVGGAFVLSSRPEPVGSRLELLVRIPDRDVPLQLFAEVRWIIDVGAERDAGMGLKFAALDVEGLLALSNYFSTLTAGAP